MGAHSRSSWARPWAFTARGHAPFLWSSWPPWLAETTGAVLAVCLLVCFQVSCEGTVCPHPMVPGPSLVPSVPSRGRQTRTVRAQVPPPAPVPLTCGLIWGSWAPRAGETGPLGPVPGWAARLSSPPLTAVTPRPRAPGLCPPHSGLCLSRAPPLVRPAGALSPSQAVCPQVLHPPTPGLRRPGAQVLEEPDVRVTHLRGRHQRLLVR